MTEIETETSEDLKEGFQEGDTYMGEDNLRVVGDSKQETGFPFNLNEEQIVRLIYFFGSRKLTTKALKAAPRTETFTHAEQLFCRQAFSWFGFVGDSPKEFRKAYQGVVLKFKSILGFLKVRPAFITPDIYKALRVAGYENVTKQIIFVVDKYNRMVPRLVTEGNQAVTAPLANLDKLQWEMQGMAMDKMMMILQHITIKDIQAANLGMKSKALRDIYAMYHMSKINNKNPNLALVNINVNATQPEDKLKTYSSYIIKNREA